MNKLVPHKAALANHAVRKHSVTSFADIGACWGVHAGYSIDVLAKNPIKKAYVADADVTKQSRAAAKPYPQLEFIEGQFNEPDFIQAFPKVDALIMYDILLHQANLDWDKFLAAWSKKTNIFIIYNQMWTKNEKTIRFLDNGLDWYLDNVFYINKDKVVEWFEKLDESHPLFGRKWRDSQQFWQFGITTADLIGTMKEIGFKLDYFENFGPFHPTRTPWIDTEGFVFVRST